MIKIVKKNEYNGRKMIEKSIDLIVYNLLKKIIK